MDPALVIAVVMVAVVAYAAYRKYRRQSEETWRRMPQGDDEEVIPLDE